MIKHAMACLAFLEIFPDYGKNLLTPIVA